MIFFMLEHETRTLVILMVCTLDKKLSRGLVRDKNLCFCLVPQPISKLNRVKKKLFSLVPSFLAYQKHLYLLEQE